MSPLKVTYIKKLTFCHQRSSRLHYGRAYVMRSTQPWKPFVHLLYHHHHLYHLYHHPFIMSICSSVLFTDESKLILQRNSVTEVEREQSIKYFKSNILEITIIEEEDKCLTNYKEWKIFFQLKKTECYMVKSNKF